MFKVTIEFASQAELVSFFAKDVAPAAVKVESPKSAATPAAPATATKAAKATAPAAPAAESPSDPKPAAEASAPAAPAASTASADVPYATLKAQVLVLVGKDREGAMALATKLGVPNFKFYEAEENAGARAAALAAVTAALAEAV